MDKGSVATGARQADQRWKEGFHLRWELRWELRWVTFQMAMRGSGEKHSTLFFSVGIERFVDVRMYKGFSNMQNTILLLKTQVLCGILSVRPPPDPVPRYFPPNAPQKQAYYNHIYIFLCFKSSGLFWLVGPYSQNCLSYAWRVGKDD